MRGILITVSPMRILTAFLFYLLLSATVQCSAAANDVSAGQVIYRQGVLPSGGALRGRRVTGGEVAGAAAACVNCHRRSGLGSAEGRFLIPPIAGKYLFRPNGSRPEDIDYRYGPDFPPNFKAYTDESLARAIRDGIARDGHALNELMPRFDLDGQAMAALIAYLKNLSSGPVPGVTEDTLHFATIITPDADPARKQAMLEVLERFFADKNEFIRGGVRPMRAFKQVMYRVTRKWSLHVWQLSGPPDTWERQLREHLAQEPVFAIVSGLGGGDWEPVHRFCESEAIPCILPNVDLPVVAENDFYSIYFSKAVLLEAQLIAHRLRSDGKPRGMRRLIQVYRENDIGSKAAQALHARLVQQRVAVKLEERVLKEGEGGSALARHLAGIGPDDALVLWLRPDDLKILPASVKAGALFVSGLMGGLEHAPLPAAWRERARLTYPFELPELRKVGMNFPLGWFAVRHIPVVDERIQSDTYLACRILAESMGDMLESFIRDYLVEQIESMLSKRLVNGYYPRLGLAPGQRFASKGGYLVRFTGEDGAKLAADGQWTVP